MADKKEVQVPKSESTAMIDYQAELAKLAAHTAETEKPSLLWVSFKGGRLNINGTDMPNGKAPVVVIHSVFENQWYKNRYDPDNPQSPSCYAISENEEGLKPHPDSEDPQSPTCAECPKNAWGSDPGGGKGKACKNSRRLGLISANDLKDVAKAEFAIAKMPVTSVKNWSTYASQLASVLKLPPLAVITEIMVEPDPKTQFQVNFRLMDKITDGPVIQALLSKRKDMTDAMFSGYDKNIAPAPGQPQAPRKF